jgi:hypothetical protein
MMANFSASSLQDGFLGGPGFGLVLVASTDLVGCDMFPRLCEIVLVQTWIFCRLLDGVFQAFMSEMD